MYSQHDPSYDQLPLGQSHLTIHGFGCFLCSLATLYQKSPQAIMGVPDAITPGGLVLASVIAKANGGAALPPTVVPPQGWCIAQTDHYAYLGYSTHFFVCNPQTKQMVDPLKYPAEIGATTYRIVNYRPFTNIVFNVLPPTQEIVDAQQRAAQVENALKFNQQPLRRFALTRLLARLLGRS